MVSIPPPIYRKRRGRPRPADVRRSEPLELVSASYQDADFVELTFNQSIDVSGMDPDEFSVSDGVMAGATFAPTGTPTMVNSQTVRLALTQVDTYSGASILLTVGAGNGIVAVGDGSAWAGVENYEIPV